jgi:hypothetical protein
MSNDPRRACVRDPETGHRVIAYARKEYRMNGVLRGYTRDADAIRAVLTDAQHFDADEIAAWPEGEDIMIPKGTSLYYWILDCAKAKGLAYKVTAAKMRNTAILTREHYGEFPYSTEWAWFGWEREGKLIDKECVHNFEASPRL